MIQLDIVCLDNVIPMRSSAFSYLYNGKERLYFLSSIDASNDGEAKLLGMTALGISPLYIGVVSISSSYSPL